MPVKKKQPPYPKWTYHHERTGKFVSRVFWLKNAKRGLARKVRSHK